MSRRVYLGRLPPGVQQADVEDHFKGFPTESVRLMGNFGFVEFQSSRDAEDAIRDFNGRPLLGENIIVEATRDSRRRDTFEPPAAPRSRGVRISVIGIPSATSWQDLKDFGRIGGNNITYADVDRNNPNNGIIEYPTLDDAEEAVKRLEGVDINGVPVTLEINPSGGDDRPREFERRPREYDDRRPPPRDFDDRRAPRDYERRDYGRDDRYGGRDRSPARGGYDNAPRRDYDRRRDDDRYVPRDARDARDARDTPRDAPRDVRDARDASRDARDARDAPRDAPREDRNGDRNGY
nr:uncharacterized protein CI109_003795 [Kwoniella shandongensis]KAA5527823.1 hypothetical protein CI109_003795 [Kwoniella shandongensis]